jgi:2-(1,2-epoxy-1,2-dihydrophenyl)acetyl-CoA isomerase
MHVQENEGVAWWREDAVGRIELRRPQRANSLARPAAHALARAIDDVLAQEPRAVLLTATGPVFCAGGDIDEFRGAGDRLDALVDEILAPLHPALERLSTAPLPVVSAVGGAIGGAGVGLALCADFVLAADSMKLRTGYAAIGLSPDLGTSWFLSRRIGPQRAKQWLMLSDAVDARTCLAHGAIDAVYPEAELPAAARALAQRLARGAKDSLAGIKRLCDGQAGRRLGEQLALEHALLRERARSNDAREGVAAFLDRRAPRFGA